MDGFPRWALELKASKTMDLAGWIDEAERERLNTARDWSDGPQEAPH